MARSMNVHARLEDHMPALEPHRHTIHPTLIKSRFEPAKPRLLPACRVSAYGAHTSLVLADRVEWVDRLVSHLAVTFELIEALALIQWQLRNVSFSAIQHTFGEMTCEAAAYGEYVIARLRDCGSKVERSIFQFNAPVTAGGHIDFAQCLIAVRDRADQLALLASEVHGVLDRACEEGDYATAKLITDLLSRTDRVTRMIEKNIPRDANF